MYQFLHGKNSLPPPLLNDVSCLRFYSKKPHIAGSKQNHEYALDIKKTWESYGFEVEMPEYEVLLSYPREDKMNVVELRDGSGKGEFRRSRKRKGGP